MESMPESIVPACELFSNYGKHQIYFGDVKDILIPRPILNNSPNTPQQKMAQKTSKI
jgi:hypothetical protein